MDILINMKIYHRTDIYSAYQIAKSQQIWSNDPYGQANFHTEKYGGGSDCKNEITLEFEWKGVCVKGTPRPWPGNVNTLYSINWLGNDDLLWSLCLFPGSNNGLYLNDFFELAIPDDNNKVKKEEILDLLKMLMQCPILLEVPFRDTRIQTIVPTKNSESIYLYAKKMFLLFKNSLICK